MSSRAENSDDECLARFDPVATGPGSGPDIPYFSDEGSSCLRSYTNIDCFVSDW